MGREIIIARKKWLRKELDRNDLEMGWWCICNDVPLLKLEDKAEEEVMKTGMKGTTPSYDENIWGSDVTHETLEPFKNDVDGLCQSK